MQVPQEQVAVPEASFPGSSPRKPANGGGLVPFVDRDMPAIVLKVKRGGFMVRAMNVLIASAAFFVLAPLIVIVALAIKIFSPGPAFYMQGRVGVDRRNGASSTPPGVERRVQDLGGRSFRMYKFRTMRVGAERNTGPVWAKRGDSRVTRLGRFLRRYRIDEIPQFWNVIRGDMNIVGPRPERPALVAYLSQEVDGYVLRHRMRPGITGWAQINQDYDTTIQSVSCKLMFDLDYIQRRSVLFDLYVMLATIPAIIKKRKGW